MLNRIYQFYISLFPHISKKEIKFAENNLFGSEKEYFFKLPLSVQKHCIKVAKHISENFPEDKLLIRAALLHDIGKLYRPLNTCEKVLSVILNAFFPFIAHKLSKRKNSFMDTFFNHSEKGAILAKSLGLEEEIIFFIQNHHNKNINNERLRILIHADNLY